MSKRLCFMNLQKPGHSSPKDKIKNIINTLRNFYFTPDYYAFAEVSMTWTDPNMKDFGEKIFAPSNPCSSKPGFTFSYVDPYELSINSSERETEQYGLLAWRSNKGKGTKGNDLELWAPERETERKGLRSGGGESMMGVRRLARFKDKDTGATVGIYHPSPRGAAKSFAHLVDAIRKDYKTIIVGDFNVLPGDNVALRTSAREYAEANNLVMKHPTEATHADGIIDYVLHTRDLTIKEVKRLPRKGSPNSDHDGIYFDFK